MNIENFPVLTLNVRFERKAILVPDVGVLNVWGNTPEEIAVQIEEMKETNKNLNLYRVSQGLPAATTDEWVADAIREENDHREWLEQLAETQDAQ